MSTGASRWRIGRAAALLAALGGLVACTDAQAHGKGPAAPSRLPVQAAGGACQLLDYDAVEAVLGVRFDVAAAAQQAETFTCVLVRDAASYPDLTLAVTSTTADVAVYQATVQPPGATAVADLGKISYSAPTAASGGGGPGVEVGWLSGNGRLITLRYRFPANATDADLAALTPKLVVLAKKVDESSL